MADLDEGIVGDFLHKVAVSAKMKKFIRWYLDWRKKNPGQGKQGVLKAAQILGLTPRDANAMIAKLNSMVKSGEMPKHLAISEEREMLSFKSFVAEKTLTPAEKKKREEIAKAIERDNPNMPMDKKMAIATAKAKEVA